MKIYSTVLEMLKQQEQGVLVTVIGGTPPLENLIGTHWIYRRLRTAESAGPRTEGFSPEEGQTFEGEPAAKDDRGELIAAEDFAQRSLIHGFASELLQICTVVMEKKEFDRVRLAVGTNLSEKVNAQHTSPPAANWIELMLEPVVPAERLIILGGGHVGQALTSLAELSGFPVVVVDDRPFFANGGLFPAGTQVICDDFSRAIARLAPGSTDYVVIVTRGHQYDRVCLKQLAGCQLAYIGMIGSKRRVAGLFDELAQEGVSREWLEKVHSPIGLNIGAETPAEIAVSILAELIQVKRKGAGSC